MTDMEKFTIKYPVSAAAKKAWNREYGLNSIYSGKHWTVRKRDAEFWHIITRSAMNKAECRDIPFDKPVRITYTWNDRMDLSNHAYMAKMIEDAMKGRIIHDDSRKYVAEIIHRFENNNYITVEVQEVETLAKENTVLFTRTSDGTYILTVNGVEVETGINSLQRMAILAEMYMKPETPEVE